jgi:acyl carrier protein
MTKLEVLQSILKENLDIDPQTVTAESTFESLGIDSLDLLELITELEERLDIDFGEPEGLENVGDLVNYLETL